MKKEKAIFTNEQLDRMISELTFKFKSSEVDNVIIGYPIYEDERGIFIMIPDEEKLYLSEEGIKNVNDGFLYLSSHTTTLR